MNYINISNYVSENKTKTLKKGDEVVMHKCLESNIEDYNKVWTCDSNSFIDIDGDSREVVLLKNFNGFVSVDYIKKIKRN